MGAAAGVDADQGVAAAPVFVAQLGQRQACDLDVVSAVLLPAFPGRSRAATGSPDPSRPWSTNASSAAPGNRAFCACSEPDASTNRPGKCRASRSMNRRHARTWYGLPIGGAGSFGPNPTGGRAEKSVPSTGVAQTKEHWDGCLPVPLW